MDFINVLQLDTLFIDVFSGGIIIFMLLFCIGLLILSAKYRLPSFALLSGGTLFSLVMYDKYPGFLPVGLILITILLGGAIAQFFNR